MTLIEQQVANVGLYTSIKHTLHVEQLLLAVMLKSMNPRTPAAIVQRERVRSLEKALAMFAANIETPTQGTSDE